MLPVKKYPFEVTYRTLVRSTDKYVTAVFESLESEFLVMPKGPGFVEYPVFEHAYEALKTVSAGFRDLEPRKLYSVILREPIVFTVLRSMLGFSPPEWAYVTAGQTGVAVTQGFVRSLDRKVRMSPSTSLSAGRLTETRLRALVETACALLSDGAPGLESDRLHRLDKADTRSGKVTMQNAARIGFPYAMLLYERFLGRPFAGHRDSVSEIIGGNLEADVEDILTDSGISYRKTKRAERIEGFDQTPDFLVPSEFNPQVIIEAKVTEDDGTARDKVTRIQHLAELSSEGRPQDKRKYEVVACIAGRGFGIRREDMKKLILATKGKVFTRKTLGMMVKHTRLRRFITCEGHHA